MSKPYIPVEQQCWFKTCQKQACKYAKVNGVTRHLCDRHGKQYSSTAESKNKKD